MKLPSAGAPIVPGLPILDEIGDALAVRFAREERVRRRRRVAIGTLASFTALLATSVALISSHPEQARAVEIATGRANDVGWRLTLTEAGSVPCLRLGARDGGGGAGFCVPSMQASHTFVARTRIEGQEFVYGLIDASASAVHLDASGRVTALVVAGRHDGRYQREVTTIPLARALQQTGAVFSNGRAFVAPIPSEAEGDVTIEPRETTVVIRSP